MADYSILAGLISSSVLVITGIAYFFGRIAPKMKNVEQDKDAYTIEGFWFLLDYTFIPLVGIGIIEMILQSRNGNFPITLISMLLLLAQALCIYSVTGPTKNAKKTDKCTLITQAIYKHASKLHRVICFEIVALYIFVKIYLPPHIDLLIPQNYRMEIYIILSSMITFMSLVVIRVLDSRGYPEAQKEK